MPKHSRRSHRVKRGGSGNYSSASTYGSYVNGPLNAQYDRVFDQTTSNAARQSNIIIGAQGQNAQQPNMPSSQNLSLVQSAGRRRISRRSRNKKGGLWGEVINQAVVPFTLLGMQQSYRRKKHGGRKTRRHRHTR
jgi:hypothetical protein